MNLFVVVPLLSILIIHVTNCYESKSLQARKRLDLDGLVELTGSVADIQTRSRITCLSECFNIDKCLSFFYNENTGRCVMHSRDFIWQTPSTTEPGWNFFITKDVSGRCPPPNYFYRHLDFCYNVNTIPRIDSDEIKTSCMNKGGKVATITSQEFHEYFAHFLNERPFVRVFLAGTVQTDDMVRLDNGTLLTYYNWFGTEPNNNYNTECCFELCFDDQLCDVPCVFSTPAEYVCEIV